MGREYSDLRECIKGVGGGSLPFFLALNSLLLFLQNETLNDLFMG